MERDLELDKTARELSELGARIESIKFHLRSLENSMALLKSLKIQFEQNLEVLKSATIIAAINEFKKVKEDLQTVRARLYAMHIDFNNHTAALEQTEKFQSELKARYVILLGNQDGRVIKGNFSGKK